MAITLLPNNVGSGATTQPATLVINGAPIAFNTGTVTVATVMDQLFRKCGLKSSQYDVSAATDVVDGQLITQRMHVRDILDVLMRVYLVDLIEVDGKIVAQKRGRASDATLSNNDLGAQLGTDPNPVTRVHTIIKQDIELPHHMDITYFKVNTDYEQGAQNADRQSITDITDKVTLNTQLVMDDNTARSVITRALYVTWVEKKTFQIQLPPNWLWLAPGDILTVTVAGNSVRMRIITEDLALFGPLGCECVLDEVNVFTQSLTGGNGPVRPKPQTFSKDTALIAWTSNALQDADAQTNATGFYCVANGQEGNVWNGCVLYMSRDGGSTFQELLSMSDPGSFGVTTNTLSAPPANLVAGMLDTVNSVTFDLSAGAAPVSCSDTELLSGVNGALIGGEVIQYQTVVNNGNNSYTLSNLVRGHRGTEVNWGGHGVGERVVLLEPNGSVERVPVPIDLFGQTIQLKAVTLGQAITAAQVVSLTIGGEEWTPYAGCQLAGSRNMSGDLTITWVRRTRSGGQWVDKIDADLGEATEAYEIDIMNGLTVARTITGLTSPTAVYTAAQQTSDFGSPQNPISVKVYQIGKYGRGYALTGSI